MRLIYFAPVPYMSYWQRPHFMIRSLLGKIYEEVYWIDPTITRLPRLSDLSRPTSQKEQLAAEPLLEGLHVLKPGGLPIEPLPGINLINDHFSWRHIKSQINALNVNKEWDIGIGRPSRLALWAARSLPIRAAFMDVMDDFPAFYQGLSRASMKRTENALLEHCDFFFCSEPSLINKLHHAGLRKPVNLIPNGYDMQRLPTTSKINPESNTIGFVGTIAAWFDWKIVIEMAKALPQTNIRLIGPHIGHLPPHLPANIELLPPCLVTDAIRYSQEFRVGIIPFLNNQLTESVDPIKYYELRALGVPVWSTSFGSMKSRTQEEGVSHIHTGADWQRLWASIPLTRPDQAQIQAFRDSHDWEKRFANIPAWLGLTSASQS